MIFEFTDNTNYTFPDDISELSELSNNIELKNNTDNNSKSIVEIPIYKELINAELSSTEKKILNYIENYDYDNSLYDTELNKFFKNDTRIYMRCCIIDNNKVNNINKTYAKIVSIYSKNKFFRLYIIELEESKKRYICNNLLFVIDDINILNEYKTFLKNINFDDIKSNYNQIKTSIYNESESYYKQNSNSDKSIINTHITPENINNLLIDNNYKINNIDFGNKTFDKIFDNSSFFELSNILPTNLLSYIVTDVSDYKHDKNDSTKLQKYVDKNYKILLNNGHQNFEYTVKNLLKKIYKLKIMIKQLEKLNNKNK